MKRGRGSDDERVTDIEMATVVHETEKAVLFRTDSGKEVWLPKSQIEVDRSGKHPVVTLPEDLAIEKELI